MDTAKDLIFLRTAITLARKGMNSGAGGPFGCTIVKDDVIIGEGYNRVISLNDPTAHAEIIAIREACQKLGDFQLTGCDLYSSCEPCPMCLGAIYWARPRRVVYANERRDAAEIGFDDEFIYEEILLPMKGRKIPFVHLADEEAKRIFRDWKEWKGKKPY